MPSSLLPAPAGAEREDAPVTVLLVDDNAAKRLALKAVLLPLGYAVVEAESGESALRCVMAQDFAVILLDVFMPDMDGFETAALIRQRRQSEMTPIIFITAYASDEIVNADRYVAGAVDFMFAPVPPDELRAKVSVFANLFIKADLLAINAREVEASAARLRLLTDAAPIGIFQTDAQNRYLYTNPRWSDIMGIPAEEAVGKPWDTIVSAARTGPPIGDAPGASAYPAEISQRLEIQVPGAGTRIVLVTSKSIPDVDGHIAGWVGTVADVTVEAEAEVAISDARDRANEASRLKSDFLANMSHEIRTPMNGVIGMTDLLLLTDLDARQRDYAQTLRNSGEALLGIIDDILDFSKVEAGKLRIEEIDFSVPVIVDEVVNLLAGPAQGKGLELIAIVDSAVPAAVSGDPGRLRQVLTNLIGNAIKFTQAGEVVVRVTEVVGAGAETLLRFEVSDTGDGIAHDKLDTIFKPFVQADTSTTRKYGGTGLGLAISAQLVALMGGTYGVSSRPGAGSRFWFTIRAHATAELAADPPVSEPGLKGVEALIVDDNATLRGVLSRYLTDWGMNVTAAESGGAALAMLRTAASRGRPFAVAVVDRAMPGVDGDEVKNAVLADPSLTTSVVLMTELGEEAEAGGDTRSGFWSSVSKPIRRDVLHCSLRMALGLQAVEQGSAHAAAQATAEQPEMGHLLLAEDNLINQKVAVAILSGAGYRVDTVLDGAAAVEAFAANHYDAILMDCHMPRLNGYQATAAIRARETRGQRIPIIAMTAGARREDKERCRAEGMDSYLAKPVSRDALLGLVARSLAPSTMADGLPMTAPGLGGPAFDEQVLDEPVLDEPVLDEPVLDEAALEALRHLGPRPQGLLGEMVEVFLREGGADVRELLRASAVADLEGVARVAHRLKGSSGHVGATVVTRLCTALEAAAREQRLVEVRTDVLGVERAFLTAGTALALVR